MPDTAPVQQDDQSVSRQIVESAVIRFAGDSGDGMQLTGGQFTLSTAFAGNELATFPDFPAEIRAPAGTTFGVSSFQINFGSRVIKTAGDAFDMLVAMNPAALKVELSGLKLGGIVIVDTGSFTRTPSATRARTSNSSTAISSASARRSWPTTASTSSYPIASSTSRPTSRRSWTRRTSC